MGVPGIELLRAWMAEEPTKRTQTFVASMLGVTQPSVSQWLREVARPEPPQRAGLRLLAGIADDAWLTDDERAHVAATQSRIDDSATTPGTGTEG